MGTQEVEPNPTVNNNGGSNMSLGKKLRGRLTQPVGKEASETSSNVLFATSHHSRPIEDISNFETSIRTSDLAIG